MVVDEDNGTLLGEVTGIQGAHGTALAPATGHGFATSGNDQSVVMFDLKTFKALGRIPAAEDADAIIYRQRIEPSLHAEWRRALLHGDRPARGDGDHEHSTRRQTGIRRSAGDGKVYANLTDTSEVVEIDAKTASVARRWSTAPCKQPVAMAIDTAHHRLFSGCRSGVMAVSDYQAGKVVATVPIGTGVDGAGFDAASGDAFASNADGTLTVIHQDSRTSIASSKTWRRHRDRATWGSTPPITACSWPRRSSDRRRRAAGAEDRCCPDHSRDGDRARSRTPRSPVRRA
jgi:DNA-binding beta-propeller fold protein YncE